MPKGVKGFQKGHKRFAGVLFGSGQKANHRKGRESPLWKGGRKESSRKWLQRHKDIARLAVVRRRARIKSVGGSFTVGEWDSLKIQYGYTCPCCKNKEPKIKLTIDHIVPLSKGGSNFIENIQPLCMKCNRKKHTKIIKFEY